MGFTYDLSIRHRSDMSFKEPIKLANAFERKDDCIFLPSCNQEAKRSGTNLRDIFAISSSKNIDYYSDVYVNIDKILENCGQFKPEKILETWLNMNSDITFENSLGEWKIIS